MITFIETEEFSLPLRNGLALCSQRQPITEARVWVSQVLPQLKKTIFVLGVGAGYHVEELCRMHPDAHVVTIDFDAELQPDLLIHPNFSPGQVWAEIIHPYIDRGFQVLKFRPAWAGRENQFERLEDLILGRGTKAFENVEWLASDAGVLEWLAEVQPGFFHSLLSVVPPVTNSRPLSEKQKVLLALRELVE